MALSNGLTVPRWGRWLSRRAARWVSKPRSPLVTSENPLLVMDHPNLELQGPSPARPKLSSPVLRAGLTPRQWTTCQECFSSPASPSPKPFTRSGFPVLCHLGEEMSLFPPILPVVPLRGQQNRQGWQGCAPWALSPHASQAVLLCQEPVQAAFLTSVEANNLQNYLPAITVTLRSKELKVLFADLNLTQRDHNLSNHSEREFTCEILRGVTWSAGQKFQLLSWQVWNGTASKSATGVGKTLVWSKDYRTAGESNFWVLTEGSLTDFIYRLHLLSQNWLEERIRHSWAFAFLSDYSIAETNEHLPSPYQESLRAGSSQNPSSKEDNYFVTPAQRVPALTLTVPSLQRRIQLHVSCKPCLCCGKSGWFRQNLILLLKT